MEIRHPDNDMGICDGICFQILGREFGTSTLGSVFVEGYFDGGADLALADRTLLREKDIRKLLVAARKEWQKTLTRQTQCL